MHKLLIPILTLIPLSTACVEPIDGDEDDATEATALTLGLPGPQVTFDAPNRLLWSDANGTGRLQTLYPTGGVARTATLRQAYPREPVAVAGDRLLWANVTGDAELWTLDDNLAVVARLPIANPVPGVAIPTGISLRSEAIDRCWARGASQGYYVLWDVLPDQGDALGRVAIQQIDGGGRVTSTMMVPRPFAGVQAVWFGRASDGELRLVFRSGTSGRDVISYRTTLAPTANPPTATLSQPISLTGPSGYRAMSAGLVTSTLMITKGTHNQVLYASHGAATDGGQARMPWYAPTWAPLFNRLLNADVVSSFAGGNGFYAKAYTSNPASCR